MSRSKTKKQRPPRPPRRPKATFVAAVVLVVFLVAVYFAAPPTLPSLFQRMAGLSNAVLAMLLVMFAIREFGGPFNGRKVPGFRRGSVRTLAGVLAFAAVFVWWLSPWAPILIDGG